MSKYPQKNRCLRVSRLCDSILKEAVMAVVSESGQSSVKQVEDKCEAMCECLLEIREWFSIQEANSSEEVVPNDP